MLSESGRREKTHDAKHVALYPAEQCEEQDFLRESILYTAHSSKDGGGGSAASLPRQIYAVKEVSDTSTLISQGGLQVESLTIPNS